MSALDKIAEAIRMHQPKAIADNKTRPGFRIWRDGCSGCDWVSRDRNAEDHAEHVAQAVIDALELKPKFRYRAAGPNLVHSPCWETRPSEVEFALELFPDDYDRIESQQRWISGWIDADGGDA